MSTPDRSRPWLAILICLTALLGFDIMGILVRLLSAKGYSAAELSAWRNVLGVIPSLIVMAWMGELKFTKAALRVTRWKLALFRGVTVAVAQLCFYSALGLLELATVSALAQTNALFVVLISVFLLGERVGPWRIFAVMMGFAGTLWILRPGSDSFTIAALLPIIASLCYAFSIVSVRMFEDGVSSALLYLWSSVASATAAIAMVLLTSGFSAFPTGIDLVMVIAMSLAGGVAVLLLMLAYRMAAPSLLAPFSYLSILTAFGFGWFIFNEAPVDTLFPGVFLIVGAGAVIMWREGRNRRAHSSPAAPHAQPVPIARADKNAE